MWFPSYGDFVGAMGYSPADPSIIDRGGASIWRMSRNGNPWRLSDDENSRATVCLSRTGQIGYAWTLGGKSGWSGPFASIDEAMDDADHALFDQ